MYDLQATETSFAAKPVSQWLDAYLGSSPFGDASCLRSDLRVLYEELTAILDVAELAFEKTALDALPYSERVVARRTIDRAFAALAYDGTGAAKAVVSSFNTMRCSTEFDREFVNAGNFVVFSGDTHDPFAASISKAFVDSMRRVGFCIDYVPVTTTHLSQIERATALLHGLMPTTWRNTRPLSTGVVLISGDVPSAYINENPESFLVNTTCFRDLPLLAETLLHETLHQKMADIRLTNYLLEDGYDDFQSEEAKDVVVPWPNPQTPRYWSAARALAAHHAYVHMAAFYFTGIERRLSYENLDGASAISFDELYIRLVRTFERAAHLDRELGALRCGKYWGPGAWAFLQWLERPLKTIGAQTIFSTTVEQSATKWLTRNN